MEVLHLNQKQLANRWSVSEATLERWRSDGMGPMFLKLLGQVRFGWRTLRRSKNRALRVQPRVCLAADAEQALVSAHERGHYRTSHDVTPSLRPKRSN
jgi:hypothetical protein